MNEYRKSAAHHQCMSEREKQTGDEREMKSKGLEITTSLFSLDKHREGVSERTRK